MPPVCLYALRAPPCLPRPSCPAVQESVERLLCCFLLLDLRRFAAWDSAATRPYTGKRGRAALPGLLRGPSSSRPCQCGMPNEMQAIATRACCGGSRNGRCTVSWLKRWLCLLRKGTQNAPCPAQLRPAAPQQRATSHLESASQPLVQYCTTEQYCSERQHCTARSVALGCAPPPCKQPDSEFLPRCSERDELLGAGRGSEAGHAVAGGAPVGDAR